MGVLNNSKDIDTPSNGDYFEDLDQYEVIFINLSLSNVK